MKLKHKEVTQLAPVVLTVSERQIWDVDLGLWQHSLCYELLRYTASIFNRENPEGGFEMPKKKIKGGKKRA